MSDAAEIYRLENVRKVFSSKNGEVKAVDGVSLTINEGEIFGIIGMSGAGKSTLVRTLNRLEKITEGNVYFCGEDLNKLSGKRLREVRQSIGMIFQSFNLLMQKSVLANVMLPMKIAGIGKKERKEKALEMLRLVGLEEKAHVYPAQLSGGQKQRVAIGRALSMNPKVLLCDEATSALDPKITEEILKLLKEINQKLKITIIIITHEMQVVEKICHRVAIIDQGKVAEIGEVEKIFTNPHTEVAKQLVYPAKQQLNPFDKTDRRCIRVVFDGHASTEPIIANLVQDTGQKVNILCANTKSVNGIGFGQMIMELPKDQEGAKIVLDYFKSKGVFAAEVTTGGAGSMSAEIWRMIGNGVLETVHMTILATIFAYIAGLPLGILLVVTGKGHILENKIINSVLGAVVNILRSVPFLILLVLLIPLTRFLVGTSIGTTATIVPLTIGAIPIVARMVESSLQEVPVGILEAAQSMGATPFKIIWNFMLPETFPSLLLGGVINLATVLGYSAMAGFVGGGGLGAIAIQYGYYRYQTDVLLITVIILVLIVQLFQELGIRLSKVKRHS